MNSTAFDSPAMTDADRSAALHDLDVRHNELLRELEALDREVQQTIAAIRPSAVAATPAAIADPGAPTC